MARRLTRQQYGRALATLEHAKIALLKPAEPTARALRLAYNAAGLETQLAADKLDDRWLEVIRLNRLR